MFRAHNTLFPITDKGKRIRFVFVPINKRVRVEMFFFLELVLIVSYQSNESRYCKNVTNNQS